MTDNLPSIYGDYNAADDFKDMRPQDKLLPRLRLMNFSSPLVKAQKAHAGAWVDSATEATVIPSGETGVLIAVMYFNEWIEWNVDKGCAPEKRIVARSADPMSEIAKAADRREEVQTPKGMKPRVTEYYSFLALAPGYFGNYTDLVMMNFARSAHRVGKAWLNRMRGFKIKEGENVIQAPMWAVGWDIGSSVKQKDGDDYYIPMIGNGTLVPNDAVPTVRQVALDCKASRAAIMDRNSNAKDQAEGGTVEVEVEADPNL